jgi:transcriptional regulator with XRE-family HTH domain
MSAIPLTPINSRLRDARREAGLRQKDVAAGTGLSRETVAHVEAGEDRYTTARTVALISAFLGVHISPAELAEIATR